MEALERLRCATCWSSIRRQAGPDKGSWDPKGKSPDAWAVRDQGGRLYVTCLSLYMLEVYYRHLPIYGNGATTTGTMIA